MHLSTEKAKKVRKSFLGGGEKEFMDNNGIDPASITKLADGEKLLEALKKDPNRCGFIISPRSNSQTAIAMDAEFDKIIDHFVVNKKEGKTGQISPKTEKLVHLAQ